jgi:hypothetical protein
VARARAWAGNSDAEQDQSQGSPSNRGFFFSFLSVHKYKGTYWTVHDLVIEKMA